jgi:hypothetical protein
LGEQIVTGLATLSFEGHAIRTGMVRRLVAVFAKSLLQSDFPCLKAYRYEHS